MESPLEHPICVVMVASDMQLCRPFANARLFLLSRASFGLVANQKAKGAVTLRRNGTTIGDHSNNAPKIHVLGESSRETT